MISYLTFSFVAGFLVCAYISLRPPPPRKCVIPSTAQRIKLSDGRHIAYKTRGVPKNEAKHKIIIAHAYGDSKDFRFPVSDEFLKELDICIISFDRAGYGESDPNPTRSLKSEAFDIQELADNLQLGPKFYVLGMSLGAYVVYSCLKYIPERLSGAALVVPLINFWWHCFPKSLSNEVFRKLVFEQKCTFSIAHHAPWLLHWWMTRKFLPHINNLRPNADVFSASDKALLKSYVGASKEDMEKVRQHGDYESLHRDLLIGFGKWEFDPTDISNPFPDNEGAVHLWQGYEDKMFTVELSRYMAQKLPWIRYHEVFDAGHLLIYNPTHCEAIFKELVASSSSPQQDCNKSS